MSKYEAPFVLQDMDATMRATFLKETHDGYEQSAKDAEARQAEAEQARDDAEAHEWRKLATYCHMMAKRAAAGILDEPDTHMSFCSFDERIGDRRVLLEVLADVDHDRDTEWSDKHRDVINAALYCLSPREKEVALAYFVGRVRRQDLAEMLSMELMTLDTHVRNIYAKWKAWVNAVESKQAVQSSLFGL